MSNVCPKCGRTLKLNETGRIGWCSFHKEWFPVAEGAEGEAAAQTAKEAKEREESRIAKEKERLAQQQAEQRKQHASAMRKIALVLVAVALIAAAVCFFVVRPTLIYKSAEEAFAAGEYEKARSIFEGLGTYRNAETQAVLCGAMMDLANGSYMDAVEKLDSLIASGNAASVALIQQQLRPVLADWQNRGITPEGMLELLSRYEDIDPEHTLDYNALNTQAHTALLPSGYLDWMTLDDAKTLVVLNDDCTVSAYTMEAAGNQPCTLADETASACLLTFGEKLEPASLDQALACYLLAHKLNAGEEQLAHAVGAYQRRAAQREAAGNDAGAVADAKAAVSLSSSEADFDVLYQTALRACKHEVSNQKAVQSWDGFIREEAALIEQFGATEKASLDAGALRLLYASELAKAQAYECVAVIEEASALGANVTDTLKAAIPCFNPGTEKIMLRLKLAEYAPDDEDSGKAAMSADAVAALNNWRGYGMDGQQALSLILLCDRNGIDLAGVDASAVYEDAALSASDLQARQYAFVDWDGDGYEELLALTDENRLVYYSLAETWARREEVNPALEDTSFVIREADVPMVFVTSAAGDGVAVYGWRENRLIKLFAEYGIVGCAVDGQQITYGRDLPGSIARTEHYTVTMDNSANRPQSTGIDWQESNYPNAKTPAAAILQWAEAVYYRTAAEQALLTSDAVPTDYGFEAIAHMTKPADITSVSVVPYAVYEQLALCEVVYASAEGDPVCFYAASVKDGNNWRMAGASARYSTEAEMPLTMSSTPLLTLGEVCSGEPLEKGKAANYRLLLPRAAEVSMLWQAGQKSGGSTAFTVSMYREDELANAMISYDLPLSASRQMSNPLMLQAGIYYVTVAARSNARESYSIEMQFSENANIERESNDTSTEANPVALNTAYTASLSDSKDIDWFAFTIDEPGRVTIKLNGANENNKRNRYAIGVYDAASGEALMSAAMPGNVVEYETTNLYLGMGNYLVSISKGNYASASAYQLTVAHEPTSFAQELESNGTDATATAIETNTAVKGSFGMEGDVDVFSFTLTHDALVQPKLSFTPLEASGKAYVVTLWRGTAQLQKTNIGGKEYAKVIMPLALPAGTYTVKLENPAFTPQDYTLTVATAEVAAAERESNNDLATANDLPLNIAVTGVIASDDDVDIYKLTLTETTMVKLDFSFLVHSEKGTVFNVSLEQNGKSAWNANCKGTSGGVSQDLQIPAGTYYIRVKPSTWLSVPYTLTLVAE